MRGETCQPLLRELELRYGKLQLFSMGWFVTSQSQCAPQPTKQGERPGAPAAALTGSATLFPDPKSRMGMFSQS